jgi:hypothetical protein
MSHLLSVSFIRELHITLKGSAYRFVHGASFFVTESVAGCENPDKDVHGDIWGEGTIRVPYTGYQRTTFRNLTSRRPTRKIRENRKKYRAILLIFVVFTRGIIVSP